MSVRVITGDCREVLATLPAESVQCCVSSPPYHGLRQYLPEGHPEAAKEIGLEQSPQEYVAQLVAVFREVKRVLREDGTLWLNLGSSYASSRDIRPSLSRRPPHDPSCGIHGRALEDCLAPDFVCSGQDDEPLVGSDFHRGRIADNALSSVEAVALLCTTARDNEPPGCAPASPAVSPRVSRASKAHASFRRDRAVCVPSGAASACQPLPLTSSAESPQSSRMSACTCGTAASARPSSDGKWGKASSEKACGDPSCHGSCGICWAYLAIPLLKFKQKDMIDIPALVALALQADGWYLRSEIIWAKPNPMPSSVRDRPTCAHEQVFLLAKSGRYFYDAAAIAEPSEMKPQRRLTPQKTKPGAHAVDAWKEPRLLRDEPTQDGNATRNARSVWTITPEPFAEAHFATFPPELAARCIKAGSSERGCCPDCGAPWTRITEIERENRSNAAKAGTVIVGKGHVSSQVRSGHDIRNGPCVRTSTIGWAPSCACPPHEPVPCTVLDPFGGAGTTGLVADRLGRDAILIELNPDYAEMARRRIAGDAPLFAEVA